MNHDMSYKWKFYTVHVLQASVSGLAVVCFTSLTPKARVPVTTTAAIICTLNSKGSYEMISHQSVTTVKNSNCRNRIQMLECKAQPRFNVYIRSL